MVWVWFPQNHEDICNSYGDAFIIQALDLKYYSMLLSTRVGRKWPFSFVYREILSLLMYFRKTSAVLLFGCCKLAKVGTEDL